MAEEASPAGVYTGELEDGNFTVMAGSRLKQGTLICLESPLMSFEDRDLVKVYSAYTTLSTFDKKIFDKLPTNAERETESRNEIEAFLEEHEDRLRETYPELLKDSDSLKTAFKAFVTFDTNSRRRPETETYDVLRMISWIQHDCIPNAALSYNSTKKGWAVYTINDIDKESQIYISYINHALTMAGRKQALLQCCAIKECLCQACHGPNSGFDEEEVVRTKLFAYQQVAKTAIPGLRRHFVATYEQMLALVSPRPEFREVEWEIHHVIAEIFAERHLYTRAIASLSKAIEQATICYGDDGDNTLFLKDFKERLDDKLKESAE